MKMIRAVITCVVVTLLSAVTTYNGLVITHAKQDDVLLVQDECLFTLDSCEDNNLNLTEEYKAVTVTAYGLQDDGFNAAPVNDYKVERLVLIPGVDIKNNYGVVVRTDNTALNYDRVMNALNAEYPRFDWDHKEKINVAAALWEFLVNQNNLDEYLAAALIGNTMYEGNFGMQQGSYNVFEDIDDARACLGDGQRGYGVVQWTYKTRQYTLLEYYELANSVIDDWQTAMVVAECCHLLREVEAYEIFDDLYSHYTIEDAVGRVARDYETYDGCYSQWKVIDGVYTLVSMDGSGSGRLQYAINIYEYFTGKEIE